MIEPKHPEPSAPEPESDDPPEGEPIEDGLDHGLRLAFGRKSSALHAHAAKTHHTPPPTFGQRFGLGVSELPSGSERYQLGSELGRGGVGAVFEARDTTLSRDLALKVLLEDHHDHTSMTRRFIEEAQIAGQLQHPGIVPVHELGELEDGRLFFAMKLIRGETLSSLLAKRSSPAEERLHYLGIFHKIGQTVAYAHSRGVIHRDLKPENVMVGSFGEVQVVDWGLAKVIGSAESGEDAANESREPAIATVRSDQPADVSMAGSVMGTPSYMSPEQARGEIDRLDARTDVFGLGAILCEIIAGQPPYEGKTSIEVRGRAARGELDDALARIERCGADPEIRSIARRCLAREVTDRPADAGEVAAEISRYLESLEERAQRAALAAAEARGKAQEERRARRWITALAVVSILFVLGLAFFQIDRVQRRSRAESTARSSLARATSLHDEGFATFDLAVLTRSRDAIEYAAEQSDHTSIDPQLESEVRGWSGKIDRAIEQAEHVAALERVRSQHGDDPDWNTKEPAYDALFRSFGIAAIDQVDPATVRADVPTSDLNPTEQRLRELASRAASIHYASAFDDWARFRRRVDPNSNWKHLSVVARQLDPHPARDGLRRAFENQDRAGLERLARRSSLEQPSALVLLGSLLLEFGAIDAARGLFTRATQLHPSDYWIAHGAGVTELLDRPRQLQDALIHYRAALALRPESPHGWSELAGLLLELGRPTEAITHYREALTLDPEFHRAGILLSRLLVQSVEREATLNATATLPSDDPRIVEAMDRYQRAAEGPFAGAALAELGDLQLRTGQPEAARVTLTQALEVDPASTLAHNALARLHSEREEWEAAETQLRAGLRANPDAAALHNDLAALYWSQKDASRALVELERAIEVDPTFSLAHRSRGELLQQTQSLSAAIESYERALAIDPRDGRAWAKLAECQQARGDDAWIESARAATQHGVFQLDTRMTLFGLLFRHGMTHHGRGTMARAAEPFRLAQQLIDARPALGLGPLALPASTRRSVDYYTAVSLQATGDTRTAAAIYDAIIRADRNNLAAATDEVHAFSLCHHAQCLEVDGEFDRALERYAEGRAACEAIGSRMATRAQRWHERAQVIASFGPAYAEREESDALPTEPTKLWALALWSERDEALGLAARAYRRWTEAVATQPDLDFAERQVGRVRAAKVALRLAGETAREATARSEWREYARARLAEVLDAWASHESDQKRRAALDRWLYDEALASVRGPAAIAALPAPERDSWWKLWRRHGDAIE